ncbi:hypothetical protein [Allobaculum sp. Allo2]|uniref:hypothetical protein n=1 Tax=Allobaculum sp. Allo2 TaxID=2853432 RepID=UPI0034630E3A
MTGKDFDLDFEKGGGLIPAVVQDAKDGTVLMVAWMNEEALEKTLETKKQPSGPEAAMRSGSKAKRPAISRSFSRCTRTATGIRCSFR